MFVSTWWCVMISVVIFKRNWSLKLCNHNTNVLSCMPILFRRCHCGGQPQHRHMHTRWLSSCACILFGRGGMTLSTGDQMNRTVIWLKLWCAFWTQSYVSALCINSLALKKFVFMIKTGFFETIGATWLQPYCREQTNNT